MASRRKRLVSLHRREPEPVSAADRLAIARDAKISQDDHLESLNAKARTFLTTNGLLIGAGLVSLARGLPPAADGLVWRLSLGVCAGVLLVSVLTSGWNLLKVLSVSKYTGPPEPRDTILQFLGDPKSLLEDSLAVAITQGYEDDSKVLAPKVRNLKMGVAFTKVAFAAFSFLMTVLIAGVLIHGDTSAMNEPNTTTPASQGEVPATKPVQTVSIETGVPSPTDTVIVTKPVKTVTTERQAVSNTPKTPETKPVETKPLEKADPPKKP